LWFKEREAVVARKERRERRKLRSFIERRRERDD